MPSSSLPLPDPQTIARLVKGLFLIILVSIQLRIIEFLLNWLGAPTWAVNTLNFISWAFFICLLLLLDIATIIRLIRGGEDE